MNVYKKIAVVGITGAGKSTFSRKIAEKTGLPLFHMDSLFWRGKWEEVPEDEYLRKHNEILANNDSWVIEGWIHAKMANRLQQADLILYLDYPGWLVAVRYVQRWFKHRKVARPELPPESRERLRLRWLVLAFFRNERSDIEATLTKAGAESKVVRFSSPKEARAYLDSF